MSREQNRPLAILVDLAGPKIRLGEVAGGQPRCAAWRVSFFFVAGHPQAPNELSSTYEPLLRELAVGDVVMLADGTVAMRVEEVSPERARLRVVQPGTIRSRQGINLPGVKLSAPALGRAGPRKRLVGRRGGRRLHQPQLRAIARRSPRAQRPRARAPAPTRASSPRSRNARPWSSSKEIVAAADGVMVARGDLGVEIDVARVPLEQKRIIRVCQELQRPVDHRHADAREHARVAAADAGRGDRRGQRDPRRRRRLHALRRDGDRQVSARGGRDDEPHRSRHRGKHGGPPAAGDVATRRPTICRDVTRAVVRGAGTMAHVLGAKLVVVASHSGRTALALSQQRSFVPTIGVSDQRDHAPQDVPVLGRDAAGGRPGNAAAATHPLHRRLGRAPRDWRNPGDRVVIVGGSHLAAGPKGGWRPRACTTS